jgi:hypothetical protein
MKPASKTPINGLYIAGADAGAKGMGTHQSALSGTAVARMVQHYLRGRAKIRSPGPVPENTDFDLAGFRWVGPAFARIRLIHRIYLARKLSRV